MFTGLIEGKGRVRGAARTGDNLRLSIAPRFAMDDLSQGASVAVDGVCLTVARLGREGFEADVSGETLARSTLADVKPGREVNLERALRLGDRLGGHLVSGHVDGVGRILSRESGERHWRFEIGIEAALARYTVEKGSIAVDGISLTVNRCGRASFEVNIIPETAKETTLLDKRVGGLVNIETDMIGKYVARLLEREESEREKSSGSRISADMLRDYGYGDY